MMQKVQATAAPLTKEDVSTKTGCVPCMVLQHEPGILMIAVNAEAFDFKEYMMQRAMLVNVALDKAVPLQYPEVVTEAMRYAAAMPVSCRACKQLAIASRALCKSCGLTMHPPILQVLSDGGRKENPPCIVPGGM
jgi:hypothetical protein